MVPSPEENGWVKVWKIAKPEENQHRPFSIPALRFHQKLIPAS